MTVPIRPDVIVNSRPSKKHPKKLSIDMRGNTRVDTGETRQALALEATTMASSEVMTRPVRVLIAEDHAVVREGTRRILERDPLIETIGEASNGQQAASLAAQLKPDVVLLDLRLPLLGGIEVMALIREMSPATQVLVLSAYDDDDYVFAALEGGASGYLLKTAHGSEVIEAIHSVSRGDVVLHPSIAAKLIRARKAERESNGAADTLSDREAEILRLAAKGLRNKDIARELGLSTRTVEGHLSHIFAKIGVSSRTEAIIFGASHNWFSLE
jgi:two-component system, NarL family, response regulator LiaR